MDSQEITKLMTSEDSVQQRYAAASQSREEALCCPVSYPKEFLSVIPQEILERDYGCGDPSPFPREGETVLDLGSGGGKMCYILAQVVGARGHVIGVDCNREMLALARRHQQTVGDRLGYHNVEFRNGMIQDLRLDLDLLGSELGKNPVHDPAGWLKLRSLEDRLRRDHPLIADNSIDCVVSNCVLNLVRRQDRQQLFAEIFRVLRPGGCAAISDIVADEDVPDELQRDPELWSGCISGAFREDQFLAAFDEAGFHGMIIANRQSDPWRTIHGIEFRSMTVVGYKGKQGACLERHQAVVYRGPFKNVEDDDGHIYFRGTRMAVCDKTYQLLQRDPYSGMFETIEPFQPISQEKATTFDCRRSKIRNPRETEGVDDQITTDPADPRCGGDGQCC